MALPMTLIAKLALPAAAMALSVLGLTAGSNAHSANGDGEQGTPAPAKPALAGLLVHHGPSARVFTLVVRPELRRRKVASALVQELARRVPAGALRFINVDANDQGTLGFLKKLGFVWFVGQHELVIEIPQAG